MNKILKTILSPVKRIIGIGYGKCNCCDFPWNMVESHSVEVKKYHGCFAVCEDCWNTKSDDEIIAAFNKLYDDWIFGNDYNKPRTVNEIGYTRKELIDAVKRDLKERNKN